MLEVGFLGGKCQRILDNASGLVDLRWMSPKHTFRRPKPKSANELATIIAISSRMGYHGRHHVSHVSRPGK
jgi:hypothetical protein